MHTDIFHSGANLVVRALRVLEALTALSYSQAGLLVGCPHWPGRASRTRRRGAQPQADQDWLAPSGDAYGVTRYRPGFLFFLDERGNVPGVVRDFRITLACSGGAF